MNRYNAYFRNRSKQGGGVLIYLHRHLQGQVLHNVSFQLQHTDSLFLEITLTHKLIIGTICRPPKVSISDFLYSIKFIVESIASHIKPCYIVGDLIKPKSAHAYRD